MKRSFIWVIIIYLNRECFICTYKEARSFLVTFNLEQNTLKRSKSLTDCNVVDVHSKKYGKGGHSVLLRSWVIDVLNLKNLLEIVYANTQEVYLFRVKISDQTLSQ